MKMKMKKKDLVNIVHCWSCGEILRVPVKRGNRRPETAGENTIDPAIRVCVTCWSQIKRARVADVGEAFARHRTEL
jgi:hypothetical protein